MRSDFISRIIGLIIFGIFFARLGVDAADALALVPEATSFIFMLVGFLFGLIITPWITVRPIRMIRRIVNEMPVPILVSALVGAVVGLGLSLLVAYPLSLLAPPWGQILPTVASVLGGYLGITIFAVRWREFGQFANDILRGRRGRGTYIQSSRRLLVDTSVLIDGRIVEIAETGFLGGTIIIPRFVLNELHQVADSSDPLRRNRGRRGLAKLNELQRNDMTPVRIIEDDIEEITEVDDKLVALALQMDAAVITNDFNLNQVAEAQGVTVLNINALSNAVRAIYIPGERFPIRIIQEGRDPDQGVGYLEDGTMVVVEHGRQFMDRTITVEVTKLINRETGRMIFAVPESLKDRISS
ncbi:MAG: PIN domain nuclease [Chloroflexi bacterium]|nr:MAG: PIN domain nuclease [Chloroflexota bacterium]